MAKRDPNAKTPRAWFMNPTPDDEAVLVDVKRHGGHRTTADAVRVALREYRTRLLRDHLQTRPAEAQQKAVG